MSSLVFILSPPNKSFITNNYIKFLPWDLAFFCMSTFFCLSHRKIHWTMSMNNIDLK